MCERVRERPPYFFTHSLDMPRSKLVKWLLNLESKRYKEVMDGGRAPGCDITSRS